MTIFYIYLILIVILLFLFLFTCRYKKNLYSQLNKKEHSLKIFYGTAFCILDIFSSLQKRFLPNHLPKHSSLKNQFEQLYAGKNTNQLEYLFHAKRISYAILFLFLFLFLGLGYCSINIFHKDKITELSRTNEDASYSLEVNLDTENNSETQIIDVTIPAKEFDYKECIALFEKYREDIINEFLGENKEINQIQHSLNLINSYADENIKIRWEIQNEKLIDYSGEIHLENVELYGATTTITAFLTLDEYTSELTIPLTLVP